MGFTTSKFESVGLSYVLNSGIVITPYKFSKSNVAPFFLVDVNGHKGPNKWGYDIFILSFRKNKLIDSVFYVAPSLSCTTFDKGGYSTLNFMKYLYGQNAEL